jgi:hypothetical protein
MLARVTEIMRELIESQIDTMPLPVAELARRRWMAGNESGPIVQLELMDDGKRGIIFAIMARDGSGPLRASFMTMLLLEDTIATSQTPFVVCSGEATVTVYRYVNLASVSKDELCRVLTNFAELADLVLGDYLPKVAPTPPSATAEFA